MAYERVPQPEGCVEANISVAGIYSWLQRYNYGYLSTVSPGGQPELAMIEFGLYGDDDDQMIIFDTRVSYEKYRNMQSNPSVAFTVGDADKQQTAQIEGQAHKLSGEELAAAQTAYFEQNDARKTNRGASDLACEPDIAFFSVRPDRLRFTDVNTSSYPKAEYKRVTPEESQS